MLENKNGLLNLSKLSKNPRMHNKYTYCFSGSQKFVNLLCICGDILVNISKYKNGHISLIFQRIKKTKVVLTMSHQNIQDCVNICWKWWFWKKLSRPYLCSLAIRILYHLLKNCHIFLHSFHSVASCKNSILKLILDW